jgi:hypothetical protein
MREALEMKLFSLEKIHTDENSLDMMINILPMTKMIYSRKKVNMVDELFPI